MSVQEFLTSLWRHVSHNVVCFPATFLLLASTSLFYLFCFSRTSTTTTTKKSLRPPSDIFKTKVCSNLALQSTGYCAAFSQSR